MVSATPVKKASLDSKKGSTESSEKPAYEFTPISNIVPPPYTAFRLPSMNESGVVAFEAFFTIEAPPTAILTSDGSEVTTIVDADSGLSVVFISSINSSGTVSFTGNIIGPTPDDPPESSGIYTSNGKGLTTVADRSTSSGEFGNFFIYGGSSINDSGKIAFLGITEFFETGIFTIDKGKVETIASNSGKFDSFERQLSLLGGDGPITGVYPFPSLNNQGTTYFTASLDSGERGIFAGDGDEVLTVVDSKGEFDLFSSPSSNDKGHVAFVAQLDDGESGVFVSGCHGKVKSIANSVGAFDDFLSDPALNEKGKVAFQATLDDGTEGIFTGSNPITDKVIAVGDALAGSIVTQLSFTGREAFNGKGQIAFTAFLEDGSEGIFRADPSHGIIKPASDQSFA